MDPDVNKAHSSKGYVFQITRLTRVTTQASEHYAQHPFDMFQKGDYGTRPSMSQD